MAKAPAPAPPVPPPAPAPAPPPAPSGGRSKLIIMAAVAVLLVLGGGGGGYWWFSRTAAHAEGKAAEPPKPATGIVALDPFLVNLADSDASRFLKVTLRLVVKDEAEAKEIQENGVQQARIRSAVLELLTTKESSALVSPEGKTALKHEIAEKTSAVLGVEVHDVLFTDFVVQF